MATLPDIDTTTTGFIAYWNAIDDGGALSIDPETALDDNGIQNYTLYDNGWTANYTLPNTSRSATVRCKTDGWITAHIDRSNTFNQSEGQPDGCRGYWDIINNWTNPGNNDDISKNELERAINSVQGNLDAAADIAYSSADVGLYNYEFSGVSNVTLFHQSGNTGYNNNQNKDVGFLYTSGTEIAWAAAVGSNNGGGSTSFDGVTIDNGNNYGSYDIINHGINAETEYLNNLNLGNSASGSINNIFLWG